MPIPAIARSAIHERRATAHCFQHRGNGTADPPMKDPEMEQESKPPTTVDQRIQWIISHPDMSPWLKTSLASARQREPLDVLNDLEILDCVLRAWCDRSLGSL
jgi:hypothetical protein